MKTSTLAAVLFCAIAAAPAAASVTTMDDIRFWAGTGANRAAIAFDWDGTSTADNALVWGFRWDGTATGEDMLRAVVAADPRLFTKIGHPFSSNPDLKEVPAVDGVGYDANDDDAFAIDDGTVFDSDGFAEVQGMDDLAEPVDPADFYLEGWYLGYWHYGTAASSPFAGAAWTPAGSGFHLRQLTDGAWESWAYEPDVYAFPSTAFAANPLAAAAPATADLDADGDVDLADLMTLQRDGFTPEELALWQSEFGQSAAPAPATLAVPEPSAPASVVLFLAVCLTLRRSC